MKNLILILLLSIPFSVLADWSNPDIQCPEKILPQGLPCPDLTEVKDPLLHYPSSMSEAEQTEWATKKAPDLKACRHQEVLRREALKPGSFKPVQIEIAWMITEGAKNASGKLKSLLTAASTYGIPPHVLIGAITQESLLANLGISPDGGNFSCGIAQLNIEEWCQGMQTLSSEERAALGWPLMGCSLIKTSHVSPFYELAKINLGNLPSYRISSQNFSQITYSHVAAKIPGDTEDLKMKRFQAVSSFVKYCQDDALSIKFKAKNLKNLFTNFVPKALKEKEKYEVGATFSKKCQNTYSSSYYPLHTGWLLAVAQYNAGPRVSALVEHYNQAQSDDFPELNPKGLIESLYWGGKIKDGTNTVVFTGMNGKRITQSWYKSCVVQRHVARVVQHVARPGVSVVRSLEESPCTETAPQARRISSGIKEI